MSMLAHTRPEELAPLEAILDESYPQAWREIVTCLYLQLRATEEVTVRDAAHAARLALMLAEGMRAELGGSYIYLPKGAAHDLTARDREIVAKFNGHNHNALAREYDVTPRHIYMIIATRSREELERRQGRLDL